MGKISQVSSKYIIHSSIDIEGVVDRPDVIGAIFGQTEGLLGADLELRELQRSGRIGRIEVNVQTKSGKTFGTIIVPSSLDKAETSIIGAALEIIQRIGPCNAKIRVKKIEDVRVSKRNYVVERAKELLRQMIETVIPDSQELADEVAYSVRVMEITAYGKERLPAGPNIDESDEIILVEGRADVLNLLKHGFKNAIALNGTSCPETIKELARKKEVTVFVDGDRGGDLIIKELISVTEIDFVTKAPDGKEVEEITKKELHKALRSRIAVEQAKMELTESLHATRRPMFEKNRRPSRPPRRDHYNKRPPHQVRSESLNTSEKGKFKELLEGLVGTKGAYILDNNQKILGKVPLTELNSTLKSLHSGVYAIVFDGVCDKDVVQAAEDSKVKHIIAMDSKISPRSGPINIVTAEQL